MTTQGNRIRSSRPRVGKGNTIFVTWPVSVVDGETLETEGISIVVGVMLEEEETIEGEEETTFGVRCVHSIFVDGPV